MANLPSSHLHDIHPNNIIMAKLVLCVCGHMACKAEKHDLYIANVLARLLSCLTAYAALLAVLLSSSKEGSGLQCKAAGTECFSS